MKQYFQNSEKKYFNFIILEPIQLYQNRRNTVLYVNIGLAHPLNECKPRKDEKQQTQLMRVLKGLSRMKAKGSPRG